MEQKIRNRIFSGLAVAAGLLLSWLFIGHFSSYRPSQVFEARYRNGFLYGIENEAGYYRVFRVDVDREESRSIRIPVSKGGRSHSLSQLCPMADGTVYVVHTSSLGQDTDIWMERCDFDKRQLIPAWDLKSFGSGDSLDLSAGEDTLRLTVWEGDDRMTWYEWEDGEWVCREKLSGLDTDSYVYEITWDGGLYLFQSYGKVYRLNDRGDFSCVYEMGRDGGYNFQFYKDEIYFQDRDNGQTYRIDVTRKPYTPVPCRQTYRAARTFDEQKMSRISFAGKTSKAGVLSGEDGRKVAAVCGEKEYGAFVLEWSSREKLFGWLVLSLFLEGIGFFLVFVWRQLKRKEILVPLVAEAAFAALILMAAGFGILRGQILKSVEENISDTTITACLRIGYEWMDFYDRDSIQAMCGFETITRDNQLSLTRVSSLPDNIKKTDSQGNELKETAGVERRLYFEKDGMLYPLGISQYILNMPLEYNLVNCDFLALQAMKRALEQKEAVAVEYVDLTGIQYAVFFPFMTGEGEYPVILETSMTRTEGNRQFAAQAMKVERLILFLGAALLSVILLVLWMGLSPLGVLKQAALQVSKGKLGTVAKVRGRSEVAKAAERFNHMSAQIASQVYGVDSYQKKYAAFIPLEFLEKAGKAMSGSGEVKQQAYMVMTAGFWGGGPENSQKKKEVIASWIRHIHEKRGEILSFEQEGLQCLFLGETENALEAAVNILQEHTAGEENRMTIAISYEEIRLGITGDESRSAVAAFNRNGDSNSFLKKCGERQGISLLITGGAARRIPGFFDRYAVRRLGICLMGRGERPERVYEVLDGEPEASRRKKLLTRDDFQDGLAAFERQEYLAARTAFIRVISQNSRDGAALHYIRLCEESLSGEAGSGNTGRGEAGSEEAGSREPGSGKPGSREAGSGKAGSGEAGSREAGRKRYWEIFG